MSSGQPKRRSKGLKGKAPLQTAPTRVPLPESTASSPQFSPEVSATDLSAAHAALTGSSNDGALGVRMHKIGDETQVTLVGDLKDHLDAFGTKGVDFLNGLLEQVANTSPKSSRYLEESGLDSWGVKQFADEVGIKQMLAFIKECKPRDPIEATLLAQMAATNGAAMSFANRLANAKSLAERDSAERTFNKLMRTFVVQADTLQRYRFKSENRVVFQHVTVNDRAQAIVGDVTRPPTERTSEKQARATPMIADERQEPLETIFEPARARVPLRRNER